MKNILATVVLVGALIALPSVAASANTIDPGDEYTGVQQPTNTPPAPQQFVTLAAPTADDVQLETEALPVETATPTPAPAVAETPAPTDDQLETLAESDDPANLIWLWFGAGAVALVLALLLVFLLRRKKEQPEEA